VRQSPPSNWLGGSAEISLGIYDKEITKEIAKDLQKLILSYKQKNFINQ